MNKYEIVTFDPEDQSTYPSVCQDPGEVKFRFGFEGGEQLLFDERGAYVGQIVKQLGAEHFNENFRGHGHGD